MRDDLHMRALQVIQPSTIGGGAERQHAAQDGRPFEEVATELIQAALARRVRRRTGKGPAKVYSLPRSRT